LRVGCLMPPYIMDMYHIMYKIYKINQFDVPVFYLPCPNTRVRRQQQERGLNPRAQAVRPALSPGGQTR